MSFDWRLPLPVQHVPRNPMLLLTSCLALVVALHVSHLPAWLVVVLGGMLFYRAMTVLRGWPVPVQAVLLPVTGVGLAGLFVEYNTLLGRDAGVAVLLLLLAAKLNESGRQRDAFVLSLMMYFALISIFFFSQDFFTSLMVCVLFVLVTVPISLWRDAGLPLRWHFGRVVRLFVRAVPFALVLFVVFPRPVSPMWSLPGQGATTGLADEITPGSFSNLAQSNQVALRAEFEGPVPARQELYWRGPVFEVYTGRSWKQQALGVMPTLSIASIPVDIQGPVYRYKSTLEPSGKPWVVALERVVGTSGPVRVTPALQAVTRPGVNRQRFMLASSPTARFGLQEDPEVLDFNTLLPAGVNPQSRRLVEGWQGLSAEQKVREAVRFFEEGQFTYTLSPPLLRSVDTVDEFLFQVKEGFCEHYAGAFAFLMRAAGVPARVVGGYQGGENNGRYLIVRQSDAHAWVEVWLEGQGWVRIDPTAAAVPERLTLGAAGSVTDPLKLPLLSRGAQDVLSQLQLQWDNWQYTWDQFVVGYDVNQQQALLVRLGWGTAGFLVLVVLVLGLSTVPWWLQNPQRPVDGVQQAYLQFTGRFARHGLQQEPSEPASQFVLRLQEAFPAQAEAIGRLVEEYQELRYGPSGDAAQQRAFVQKVRRFRLKGRPSKTPPGET